jgi:hypothetical protein
MQEEETLDRSVSVSAPVASGVSGVPSTTGRAHSQHSAADLLAILNIPAHLTDKEDKSLKSYYQKYKACIQAQHTSDDLASQGQWPTQKKPSMSELITLFVSPSMWHSHVKKMAKVPNYPAMQEWLEGGESAPDDMSVWGFSKTNYNFTDLKGYFDKQDEIAAVKGKRKKSVAVDDGDANKKKKKKSGEKGKNSGKK